MDLSLKQQFAERWGRYFPRAELPIAFSYADDVGGAGPAPIPPRERCFVCALGEVRAGASQAYVKEAVGCAGGRRYLGFSTHLRPNFEYFLSYGIPGEMEGERYKKSPERVRDLMREHPPFEAPGRSIVFKRWDKLGPQDEPLVVVFFAAPDVLSGLFTLANYDEATSHGVVAPMGSGCSSIVYYPYLEGRSAQPRAVLGMFDVSARPCVPADVLTFAVPWTKFVRMVENMEESFLITASWGKVRSRIAGG